MALTSWRVEKIENQCQTRKEFAHGQCAHLSILLFIQHNYSEALDFALEFNYYSFPLIFFSVNMYYLEIKEAISKLLDVPDMVAQLVNFLFYEHNVLI